MSINHYLRLISIVTLCAYGLNVVFFQIKVFMVSNCFVGSTKEPVIAVCLKDIESMLSYSHSEIKTTLEKKRYAQISSHSFLRADSPTCTIIKGKTDRKRRCLAFFQQMMCQNLAKHLIKCEFHGHSISSTCSNYIHVMYLCVYRHKSLFAFTWSPEVKCIL